MTRNVLIIEDQQDIRELIALHLRDLDCATVQAETGEAGLDAAERQRFDLVILDLMLPGMDGLEVCRRLRALPGYLPILMLTAKSTELDRVMGLETGADDYLTKPFGILELLARIKALFRRVEAISGETPAPSSPRIRRGELAIDTEQREVRLGRREVQLTAKEFDLLVQFAAHPGRVYSRAQLLDLVWGYTHQGYEHTVNSHINRLRNKIEADPSEPRYILTVWGVGYKFAPREDADA